MPVSRGPVLCSSEQGASLMSCMSKLSYIQGSQNVSLGELREGGTPGVIHEQEMAI